MDLFCYIRHDLINYQNSSQLAMNELGIGPFLEELSEIYMSSSSCFKSFHLKLHVHYVFIYGKAPVLVANPPPFLK